MTVSARVAESGARPGVVPAGEPKFDERTLVLRYVQPGLVGVVTGVMTTLGGVFHSLPFLISRSTRR